MRNKIFSEVQIIIASWYFLSAKLTLLKENKKTILKYSFMLLTKVFVLICTLHWCAYNLVAKSVSQDTTPFSLLGNIGLGIMWAIILGNYVVLLDKQMIAHSAANAALSQNQTPEVSGKTNQNNPDLESLIAGHTTKLEYAINQLQTKLTKQLQSEESLLCISKAVEEASDAICIADANGFPTYINKTFLQLFRYSIDELNVVGGLFSLFATPAVGQEIHSLILDGYSWNGEVEICTRKGKLIQVALHAEAIENQTSQVIGIIAIFTNITEHKEAEAAFQKSENRLNLALSTARMAVWDWNIKTRELIWSNNLGTVFGINPETFNGDFKTLLKYIHPDDHQKLTQAFSYAIDEHLDYTIEFRALWPNGSIRWMESKGQLLYDENGQAIQMLGTVLDITERKET